MRYGRPKTAARKKRNGFLEGRGRPGGPSGDWLLVNAENAEGVKAVASAGGGRPVNLAKRVRIHRITVKMPKIEPSVLRRFPNCSATDTIAKSVTVSMVKG